MYKCDKIKSLLVLIQNSLGTKFFQSLYFFINGKSKDIFKKGDLSCAFYVSTILKIIGLIENIHATVDGTIKDLEKSGWYKINKPQKGAVIVWEKNKSGHKHLGFYLGNKNAVSNSSKLKKPIIHHLNYEYRKIESIYFHQSLGK